MITVNDIVVEFGGTTLFSEVTFAINETDKIALMGKNGAGKSTLLKIVAGVNKPTRGNISAPSDAVIAFALGILSLLGSRVPLGLKVFFNRFGSDR